MIWTVLIQLMAVQTIVIATLSKPSITVKVQCLLTLEVSCSEDDHSFGIWLFYMHRRNKIAHNMAKVFYKDSECSVVYSSTLKSLNCVCVNETSATCNISGYDIVKDGEEWHCSEISTGHHRDSEKVNLNYQDFNKCTTTTQTATQIIKHESIMTESYENETSTVTTTEVRFTKTTENSITTENATVTETHNITATEENEHRESPTKHDIIHVSLMIAGSFVLFDIGLVVFIYRKKLLSCLRGIERKLDLPIHNNANISVTSNINMAAVLNNVTWSNGTSSSMEPVSTRIGSGLNTQQQCASNGDEQPDLATKDSNVDDPLYSYVRNNTQLHHEVDPKINSNPHQIYEDLRYDISMNDDQLYSSIEDQKPGAGEGACGFSVYGEEQSSSDPLYDDTNNIIVHYTTVKKDRPLYNKKYKDNPMYACNASTLDSETSRYSKIRESDLHATANHLLGSVDDLAKMHGSKENTNGVYNRGSQDDPLYLTVNKKDAPNIIRTHVAPVYSMVRKKPEIAETSNGAAVCDENNVDPVYSVVNKKKTRGMETDLWNQSVPPVAACANSVVPPYSKVNKNKKCTA
ncbi:uncharacterized protein LOC127867873 isoform X2 [Dreissena polymorpha]|uniref:uncharacterized protein LOC127867873 isoform X2 n=1 Tax=Dreissena polymorpha TaxID=45954 RepID=UPI0022647C33|nr:uncharacterized protein LOC127867873 isoform X2 [Dreissena polymorpha]